MPDSYNLSVRPFCAQKLDPKRCQTYFQTYNKRLRIKGCVFGSHRAIKLLRVQTDLLHLDVCVGLLALLRDGLPPHVDGWLRKPEKPFHLIPL